MIFEIVLISLYGFFLLPFDNTFSLGTFTFALVFFAYFLHTVRHEKFIILFSCLVWLYPFLNGVGDYGYENAFRATIPIFLMIVLAVKDIEAKITQKQINWFLIVTTLIVARYMLLIYFEVSEEVINGDQIFSGSTRALINEPILIGYFILGTWIIFNVESTKDTLLVNVIKLITLTLLAISIMFQVRFLILAFALIAFFSVRGHWRFISIIVTVFLFVLTPKFSEVTLSNGKIDEILEVFYTIRNTLINGQGLGAMREIDGVMVRFTHTAFSTFALYGGLLGFFWYILIIIKVLHVNLNRNFYVSLPILLIIIHTQLVQPGFKMFGLISLPIYFYIIRLKSIKIEK
jgi:hypothetical protein